MNIKYLFGDAQNYMQYTIDVTAKTIKGIYVRSNKKVLEKVIDISDVVDYSTPNLPKVELAKRGYIWDFRISRTGVDGKVVRRTLSILADFLLAPTSVEFDNASSVNRTIKDLLTYPLSAYDSPMTVKQKIFTDATNTFGESSDFNLNPVIVSTGLLIGRLANLSVMLSAPSIPATTDEMYFGLKFGELPNMATNTRRIDFEVGLNLISINKSELQLNGTKVCDIHGLLPQHRIVFSKDMCVVGGVAYPCNWVDSDYEQVRIKGDGGTAVFNLEDIVVQAVENFFQDSVPPASITHLGSVSGDKEVTLDWRENTEDDLAGYNVYVNGVRHNLALIPTAAYQVTGLTNGLQYLVTVTAVDKSGNESIPVESLKIRTISDPAKEVKGVTVDSHSGGVDIKFIPPTHSSLERIRIYQEDLSNLGIGLVAELPYNHTEYTIAPPPNVGRYMYMITTVEASGEETTGVQVFHYVDYV